MSDTQPESSSVSRLVTAEEREVAVRRLTSAFSSDAIAVDEFERRVAAVYKALTADALAEVTRDLPEAPSGPASSTGASVPARASSAPVARRSAQQVSSILGSLERRLDGPMPEQLEIRAVAASVELDLRRADFPPGVTEIQVLSIMGSIELELPDHVRVEDHGQAILGNFSVRGRFRGRGDHDAPVVRITGRAILGNVEVELDD